MFPVGEFNFVVAGLATFAATLPKDCKADKRHSPLVLESLSEVASSSALNDSAMQVDHENETAPLASKVEAPQSDSGHDSTHSPPISRTASNAAQASVPTRRESLKRKAPHDGFDEPIKQEELGYPHNLANIYPNKRSRTPSADSVQSEAASDHPTLDSMMPSASSMEQDVKIPVVQSDPEPILSVVAATTAGISVETPATEPPHSPSPPPEIESKAESVLEQTSVAAPLADKTAEASGPVAAEETVAVSTSPSEPVSAPAPAALAIERSVTPVPTTPKPYTHPGFGTFSLSRPSTPSAFAKPFTTTVSSSNAFAAFAGTASPFAAASAFSRPAGSPVPSIFGSSSSLFAKSAGSAPTSSSAAATPSPFGANSRDIFRLDPKAPPVWGTLKGADLKTHQNEPEGVFTLDKKADAADGASDAQPEEQETEEERVVRVEAELRRIADRQREEAEVREQEKREKEARKEYKRRERAFGHAIVEAAALAAPTKDEYTPVTGEENEDVELEQKGVKLYIKRGAKTFSEPIQGHIKLLAHRTTLEERILFRREPLWKVSMNVRVQPTLRVTYSSDDNALRFILKEPVPVEDGADASEGAPKQEIVIYVVKPGRSCSKQDFKEFAESLVESSNLKPDGVKKARLA